MTQEKLALGGGDLRELIDRPCWEIAEKLGLGYFGDSSLIHGGTFFRRKTWRDWEYVEAVRVLSDDGCVFITSGTINRADVEDALRSCGWRYAGEDADLYECEPGDIINDYDGTVVASGEAVIDCEISACDGWAGVEPDSDFGGTDDYCCPIVETENGEFFQYREINSRTRNISLDCLEGFIVRRFLIRMLPTD